MNMYPAEGRNTIPPTKTRVGAADAMSCAASRGSHSPARPVIITSGVAGLVGCMAFTSTTGLGGPALHRPLGASHGIVCADPSSLPELMAPRTSCG